MEDQPWNQIQTAPTEGYFWIKGGKFNAPVYVCAADRNWSASGATHWRYGDVSKPPTEPGSSVWIARHWLDQIARRKVEKPHENLVSILQADVEALCAAHLARQHAPMPIELLEFIRQYGSDTLSGPVGDRGDRKWYRDGVMEMTARATRAIAALKSRADAQSAGQPMTDDAPICECPKCGRTHRSLQAGTPPLIIANPERAALEKVRDELQQSNGGKGPRLPLSIHILEIVQTALKGQR